MLTGTSFTFTKDSAIPGITPVLEPSGVVLTSCTTIPTLPAGLTIDNTTCAITGTPSATVASTSYAIVAINGSGYAVKAFSITVSIPSFTIGGTITGLTAGGLELQNNAGNDLAVLSGATTFTFGTAVANGAGYAVTVKNQPAGLTCTVANGTGTATANVTTPSVACATTGTGEGTSTFSIGGTITGLTAAGLVLQNNTADDLTVASGATSFTFATKVSGAYAVTVKTQPTGLFCTVTSGTGTATADVSNVTLACVAQITKDWGTFTDMNNGTVRLVVNPGTYGGQTYTAQTLFYAKCSHGQTYNAGGNTCTGTATLIQFCTSGNNSCNGNDANQPVSSGALFNACNGLSLASKTWRVPTKNELKLLIECTDTKLPNDLSICGGAPDPSINNLFPVTATPLYWSSTTYAPSTAEAWIVLFRDGNVNYSNKSNQGYVRCISGP